MLIAALAVVMAPAAADAQTDAPTREAPLPASALTFARPTLRAAEGGQRLRLTVPADPGVDAFGDDITYSWYSEVPRDRARCRPGPLPDLSGVKGGTVLDAALP